MGLQQAKHHLREVENLIGSINEIRVRIGSGSAPDPQHKAEQAVKELAAAVQEIVNVVEEMQRAFPDFNP